MTRQKITASIVIDVDPVTLWDVANDPRTYTKAIDWVYDAWWENDGSPGQGSVYVERAKPGPKEGIYRWVITSWDPPRRAVHSHNSGEMDAELELTFEPLGEEGTQYTQTMTFRALPSFRPLGFILERTLMKRKMQRDFEEMVLPNIKRLAEERASRS